MNLALPLMNPPVNILLDKLPAGCYTVICEKTKQSVCPLSPADSVPSRLICTAPALPGKVSYYAGSCGCPRFIFNFKGGGAYP